MRQITHVYKDIATLKAFCDAENIMDYKAVLQLHTGDVQSIHDIKALFEESSEWLQIIHISETGVETTLHFSLYNLEAELQNNSFFEQDLYKAIIDSTKEGFWMLDESLDIISVNQAFSQMLGYQEDELLGKKPFELLSLVGEQQAFCQEQSKEVNRSVQRTYELTFVTKEGKAFYTIVNATTINLPDSCVRTFAFITDISEQKQLEKTLIEQKQHINTLNKDLTKQVELEVAANRNKDHIMYQQARLASMGEMVANIAHQWRQPLNIIALIIQDFYISSQLGTLEREKVEKEYDRANTVLQYMSSTIDDFRTYFQHNDKGERFSIQSSVDSVLTLVSKSMEYNKIAITCDVDENATVFGHKNEFVQTLINLVNNAREAIMSQKIADGVIKVKAYIEKDSVHVLVQDNGGGIDDDYLEQIFEPYFTTKHQTQGTGLGLYMGYQIIVNNLGGSIKVENREGGTCFHMTLPYDKGDTAS